MRLDEELNKIKNDIPSPELNASYIYSLSQKKDKRKLSFDRRIVIIAATLLFIITLSFSIPFISYTKSDGKTLVKLLSEVSTNYETTKPDNYEAFSEKYNEFAAKISEYYVAEDKNNTVISPITIFTGLIIMCATSQGDSKQQILDALDMDEQMIIDNYSYFYYKHNYKYSDPRDAEKIILSQERIYNSIWINENININYDFVKHLSSDYYCYPYKINYLNNDSNKSISEYVKENTNVTVNENFNVQKNTNATIISASYFKDTWPTIHLRQSKEEIEFINYDSSKSRCKFNVGDYQWGYAIEEEDYYHYYIKAHTYNIVFILPKEGKDIHKIYNNNLISSVRKTEYEPNNKMTRCVFPNFKLENSLLSIKNILINKFYVVNVFDDKLADLSNLFHDQIFIGDYKHKSILDINSEGIGGVSDAKQYWRSTIGHTPDKYYDFIINRAFGVLVINKEKEIIYSGIVDKI